MIRIPVALIADYALAHPDGKLYVTGGGLRRISFPTFPAARPRLALALGIEVSGSELGKPHTLTIEVGGPDGKPVTMMPVVVNFAVPQQPNPTEPGYFHFVSNMESVVFPVAGLFAFKVMIDGEERETIPLRAVSSNEATSESDEWSATLNRGYEAFAQGDAGKAEELFREVLSRFPALAGGHNNLGFVQLARNNVAAAKASLLKARELGYPRPEINDANIAAALYLEGDVKAALELFETCLRERVFRIGAMLFGIDREGIFNVYVASAADYVSLMALNACWSARALGDRDAARRYLVTAKLSELWQKGLPGAERFEESIKSADLELTTT